VTIRIWQSYSCNNSSSYRLVARFADPASALEVARDLEALFPVHAAEIDARPDYSDDPSQVEIELGKKYGFEWSQLMYWGSGGMTGDSPDVFVEGRVLIVQHTYCGGGLGDGLATYLEKRGATGVSAEDTSDVQVSLVFRAPRGTIEHLDDELATMFAQRDQDDDQDLSVEPLAAPWQMDEEPYGELAYFRDAGTVGLCFPLDPRDLDHLHAWLKLRGIDQPILQIEQREDLIAFEAIRKARCTACGGPLEYLHPALHDIETPQLVCRPCGGFYEVSTFTAP